jgi:general secretion pathway protein A
VGTGKTTLVRTLLGQMPSEVDVALILNPQLTAAEFLVAICEELGVPLPDDRNSSKSLVDALNLHLLAAHARGRRTILLVDEAQNLSAGVLEQLRLLTNLETAKQKLLQIVLIAQPELRDLLSQTDLRQLAQRVTGRYHLEPLSREEAARYIDHRLKVAGGLGEIFDAGAKREVYRLSGGIPRLMNVICDRALLGAYSRETRKVNKWIVRRAAAEVSGQRLTPIILKRAVPVFGVIGVALAIIGIWSLINRVEPRSAETVRIPVSANESIAQAAAVDDEDRRGNAGDTAPPDGETIALEQMLRAAGGQTSVAAAMSTLFGLWNEDYVEAAGRTACQQAEAKGLSCYFSRGSWGGIRQLDRPVMLTLTDSRGDTHQPVLVSLTETAGELAIADTRVRYSLDDISEMWFGQYLLVWRPPNGRNDVMRPGMRDENVRWLRQSLAAIDAGYRTGNPDSDLFDEELEQQLMEFQRAHRLRVDGIAGQQTQILINSLLEPGGTPQLVAQSR